LRWCIGSAAATTDPGGHVQHVSGVTVDITERKEAEERQALLAREVDHRARNALAIVQSIIRLTRAENLPVYVQTVEGRIKALSFAHQVLSQSRWEGADLRRLVEEELAPYRTAVDTIAIDGPDVTLEPTAAQTLALSLHELATNAAKYGALSVASGRVQFSWQVKDGELVMRWVETGGPKVGSAPSKGFGTKIITESIERQLGGRVMHEWEAAGLRCTIGVPSAKIKGGETFRAPGGDATGNGKQPGLGSNRIMIVEDEILVGMELADSLAELGLSVLGPYTSLAAARQAAAQGGFDAALLDVNLAGEAVYPIAELLIERGLPFAFITGYGAESIDPRFNTIPVLQKPVEQTMLRRLFTATEEKGDLAGVPSTRRSQHFLERSL
jgi:two-component sensor histidine kinase